MTMPYRIVLSTPAADAIRRFHDRQQVQIARQLRRLAKSPAALSWPSVTPPYPPGYQMFEFDLWSKTHRHHFVTLFKYRSNETEIFIHAIGHTKLRRT